MRSPPSRSPRPSSPSKLGGKKQEQEGKKEKEEKKQHEMQQQQGVEKEGKEARRGGGRGEEEDEKSETATLEAVAAMEMAAEAEELKKRSESFEIYNKGLTAQMTFDEAGHPILVPLSESAAAAAALGLLPTTTAGSSEDTEGQYEAVPPPQGPCAGLCPPYGALPEQMPLAGAGAEKLAGAAAAGAGIAPKTGIPLAVEEAEAAGEEVLEEAGELYICKKLGHGLSIFTLPSRTGMTVPLPVERDCPVPLWQHLPPSPFINRQGVVGVDVYAIGEDLGAADYRDAIPLYDFQAVTEAAAAAGRELQQEEQQLIKQRTGDDSFFKRLDTLMRSERGPETIALD